MSEDFTKIHYGLISMNKEIKNFILLSNDFGE